MTNWRRCWKCAGISVLASRPIRRSRRRLSSHCRCDFAAGVEDAITTAIGGEPATTSLVRSSRFIYMLDFRLRSGFGAGVLQQRNEAFEKFIRRRRAAANVQIDGHHFDTPPTTA